MSETVGPGKTAVWVDREYVDVEQLEEYGLESSDGEYPQAEIEGRKGFLLPYSPFSGNSMRQNQKDIEEELRLEDDQYYILNQNFQANDGTHGEFLVHTLNERGFDERMEIEITWEEVDQEVLTHG